MYVIPSSDVDGEMRSIELSRENWSNFHKKHPLATDSIWLNRKTCKGKVTPALKQLKKQLSSSIKSMLLPRDIEKHRLKQLIHSGVLPEMRGEVWWAMSGGHQKATEAGDDKSYAAMLSQSKSKDIIGSALERQVDIDLPRTFPFVLESLGPKHFKAFLHSLRNVLLAYAMRNREVGYCQSMNFIAALLLLHMPEERAFWVLAVIIEEIAPTSHLSTLLGVRVDQLVLQTLVASTMPDLNAHFKKTDSILEPVICPWFLCLYINALPLYTVCRVWDCVFWHGYSALFRFGIQMFER